MKNLFLLLSSMLLAGYLNAQTTLPHAGEFSAKDQNYSLLRPGVPPANQLTEIINFDSLNVSFRGNYPFAESYALARTDSGNIVFIGSGGGIFITDVSDPANPLILSEIRTRSLVDNCTYDPVRKRLYVCAYFSGIEIWDLTDISDPFRMSRIPTEPYPRSGVAFIEDYLLVTTNNSLWTIDAADPYNPVIVKELFLTNNLIIQMYLKDTVLYTVSDIQGIKTIDVSDPLDPQLIASTAYASGSRFDISGNYLFAVKSTGLTVLDISNPASISFAGGLILDGYPEDIVVFDNKAYISKQSTGGGLQIVNVENPASPVAISLYPGNYRFVEGKNHVVYLTLGSDFSILDITDPQAVNQLSGLKIPGFVNDIAVSGRYAYTGSNGFRVIDLSDTTHPVLAGYADISGSLVETYSDSIVLYCPYSMGSGNKVYTMDVSDPANPVVLDYVSPPAMTWDLDLKDETAFVSGWWDGVRIYSFENPLDIQAVSHPMGWVQGGIPGTDWCYVQAQSVEGNYLYLVDYGPFPEDDTYGLYILDISNLSSPVLIKRFKDITGVPQDIEVVDGIAYIADGSGGLEIVNVTDPNSPAVIGYFNLPDGATGVTVDGDYAYVSNYILGGVQVIDVTTPAVPVSAGWYKPSGCFALNVETDNGCIYISDGIAGMQIYRNLLEPVTAVEQNEMIVDNFNIVSYPNPFNPTATIQITVPRSGVYNIKVYNSLGEETAELLNDYLEAGTHKIKFNASGLPSGIYFYRMESESKFLTGKMVLLK